jgi:hypothetical protein
LSSQLPLPRQINLDGSRDGRFAACRVCQHYSHSPAIAQRSYIALLVTQVMAYFAKRSYLAFGGVRFFNGPVVPQPSEMRREHASRGAMPYDYQVQPQYHLQNQEPYDPYYEAR